MLRRRWLPLLTRCVIGMTWGLIGLAHGVAAAELAAPRQGDVRFTPCAIEAELPEMFRLEAHEFSFAQEFDETVSPTLALSRVTFPSPVITAHANNNTVHTEYFRPLDPGKHPGVVVLHILGGDFDLSRLFCRHLASNGVAALFVIMPYYGPRRQPDAPARMISEDPRETVKGLRQAVLDIRRARAWLASQDEVDAERLGIFGISLGGITTALVATAEPRFGNVCMMLAGGDLAQVSWTSPELKKLRDRWVAQGGTKEEYIELLAQVDPVTHAGLVRERRILMLNASHDEVIPKSCTESLWKAFGQPEIVWYDAGHYSAMRYVFDGLHRVTRFFQAAPAAQKETG